MIAVLSDSELERIEDALASARHYLPDDDTEAHRVEQEIQDALGLVQATRRLMREWPLFEVRHRRASADAWRAKLAE